MTYQVSLTRFLHTRILRCHMMAAMVLEVSLLRYLMTWIVTRREIP